MGMNETKDLFEEIKGELLPFESWERLPGETSGAYAAFSEYRDFGPERNIRKAVEAYFQKEHRDFGSDRSKVEKRYRMWRLWSMQYRWLKRAEDYDKYLDKLKQTELRKSIEAQGEAHRAVTGKMLAVVNKKLDLMEPGELTQGAVVEWVETAIRTEREIAGISSGKDSKEAKPGTITFTQEFEGL
jgi:hypothetical protein